METLFRSIIVVALILFGGLLEYFLFHKLEDKVNANPKGNKKLALIIFLSGIPIVVVIFILGITGIIK